MELASLRADDQGPIPTAEAVEDARVLLRAHLPRSRMIVSSRLSARLGAEVRLKLECELPTGSFKPRGALYALARRLREERVREVVASSTGNHGAAVAWAARTLGVAATIFLPERPNPVKRGTILGLGAAVHEVGADLAAAADAARGHALASGAYFLDDATDPVLPAGPATIMTEVLEDAPHTRAVFVPVGDTALIRGVAAVAKRFDGQIRIIGVQASLAPSYFLSWQEGRVVGTETCATLADGLATRTPVPANVEAIRSLVDEMVLVTEEQLLDAVVWLLLEEHIVAEPAGAAATAAVLARRRLNAPSVVLVTGSNLAPSALERAARRAVSAEEQ